MSLGRLCFSNQTGEEDDYCVVFISVKCVHIVDEKKCLKIELELFKETSHRLRHISACWVSLMEILFGH
jgi:hypothetical protein